MPTNLTPILGPQHPPGQEYRQSGVSSSSLLPGSLVPGQPSVIPNIQTRPDYSSGMGRTHPHDEQSSQGQDRTQGDSGFNSQNVRPELDGSGPSLHPANGPQQARAGGQVGLDAELQGLTDKEAVRFL